VFPFLGDFVSHVLFFSGNAFFLTTLRIDHIVSKENVTHKRIDAVEHDAFNQMAWQPKFGILEETFCKRRNIGRIYGLVGH